ncbi:hypothetical protein BC835DRAFT_1303149 [Cytidiella melzeri]|nr:hypothetical protein BC835DRAFT_1303149 [Cytidiella melzeri]
MALAATVVPIHARRRVCADYQMGAVAAAPYQVQMFTSPPAFSFLQYSGFLMSNDCNIIASNGLTNDRQQMCHGGYDRALPVPSTRSVPGGIARRMASAVVATLVGLAVLFEYWPAAIVQTEGVDSTMPSRAALHGSKKRIIQGAISGLKLELAANLDCQAMAGLRLLTARIPPAALARTKHHKKVLSAAASSEIHAKLSNLAGSPRSPLGRFSVEPKITSKTFSEHKYKFDVKMTCGGCSSAVERVLKKTEGWFDISFRTAVKSSAFVATGVTDFTVDLEKQEVLVAGSIEYDDLLQKIKKTGKEGRIDARGEVPTPSLGLQLSSCSPLASKLMNSTLPTIPDYSDDYQWLTAYLVQHRLSQASWVYAYILWLAIAAVFLTFSILHWTRLRGGYIGAVWNKWALRRRTWRKKHSLAAAQRSGQPHSQPHSFSSNAQILALVTLFVSALALSAIGPDYLAPGSHIWNLSNYPSVNNARRDSSDSYNPEDYFYLQPQFTINKAWWTAGGRTGLIAFALFPLTVLLALKAPPFALLSSPYFVQLAFDKLAILHRWCGFLVWLLATMHTVFWCIQLAIDHRARTGEIGLDYAWQFEGFDYAWAAYGSFTMLMLCSIPSLRRHHYEAFWFMHVLFVPLTLVFSALHHAPIAGWCWGALALWIGERCYRFTWWLNTNGFFGGMSPTRSTKLSIPEDPRTSEANLNTLSMHVLGQNTTRGRLSALPRIDPALKAPTYQVGAVAGAAYTPPPGFVHAELLPGRTIRVRIVTPVFLSWYPGQHFLLNIPSISRITSHPFTCASVCDSLSPHDSGREIVFFIRAKKGWTKELWETLSMLCARGLKCPPGEKVPEGAAKPSKGVLMRGYVDGPFGSAARVRWGEHSSVLLVAGGSGVSFALGVLRYLCMCLAGRDGQELGGLKGGYGKKGFKTTRVRFVWIVSQFGHVHWCAHALRQCMALVSLSELQIDIFVTNVKPELRRALRPPPTHIDPTAMKSQDPLMPPTPMFILEEQEARRSSSDKPNDVSEDVSSRTSVESDISDNDLVDWSYYSWDIGANEQGELGHDEHVLDLTNFEGDDDTAMPGEAALNDAVKKEGAARRSFFRQTMHFGLLKHSKLSFESYRHRPASEAMTPIDTPIEPTLRFVGERPRSMAMLALGRDPRTSTAHIHPPSPESATTPTSSAPLLSSRYTPKFTFPPPRPHSPITHSPHVFDTLPSPMTSRTSSPTPNEHHDPRKSFTSSIRPDSVLSHWSDAHSLAALVSEAAAREDFRLEFDEEELVDISVVAERTRAGRPAIHKILADEVERARGSVIVGCCGPTSLNAVMRKNVAAQIDPGRLWRGDERGMFARRDGLDWLLHIMLWVRRMRSGGRYRHLDRDRRVGTTTAVYDRAGAGSGSNGSSCTITIVRVLPLPPPPTETHEHDDTLAETNSVPYVASASTNSCNASKMLKCTSPAGSDYRNAGHRDNEPKAGLGLELPSAVLTTSLGSEKFVGLGIYIDFESWDGGLVSPKMTKSDIEPSRLPTLDVDSFSKVVDECPGAPILSYQAVFTTPTESIASRLDLLCLLHEDGCESCNSPSAPSSSGILPPVIQRHLEEAKLSQSKAAGLGFNLEDWAGWSGIESVVGADNGVEKV